LPSPPEFSCDIQVRNRMILRIAIRILKTRMNIETERMAMRVKRKIMIQINMQVRILCKIMRITGR
jgi:hypothetical protein